MASARDGASPVRDVVEVAPGVLVTTSRRYETTSTIIVGGDTALVVDPAWDPDELAGIPALLIDRGLRCTAGLATHVHYDHVLWHPELPDVPRWATPWTVTQWSERRDELLAPLRGDLPADLLAYAGNLAPVPDRPRPEPYPLPWGGREILLHEHDAHAPCHVAAEVVDAGVLLAGDMLSDVELPMPGDEDLVAYLAGLDRLAPVAARSRLLVPGHGSPSDDPLARVDADRRYVEDLLAGRGSDDPRRALPGMAELHEANLRLAEGSGTRG
jgi:glyoxylase-like metal-dependent hydrolase (beta-lactamase superfamily II)